MLVAEIEQKKQEKERVVKDCFPPLNLPGLSVQELQVLTQKTMLIQAFQSTARMICFCKPGVSTLRPGGQMWPADHFESALSKFKKYNGIWPTNETCACLMLYLLNINVKIHYTVVFMC